MAFQPELPGGGDEAGILANDHPITALGRDEEAQALDLTGDVFGQDHLGQVEPPGGGLVRLAGALVRRQGLGPTTGDTDAPGDDLCRAGARMGEAQDLDGCVEARSAMIAAP